MRKIFQSSKVFAELTIHLADIQMLRTDVFIGRRIHPGSGISLISENIFVINFSAEHKPQIRDQKGKYG